MKKPILVNTEKLTRESHLFSHPPMPKRKDSSAAKVGERNIESFNSHFRITWKDKK